MTVPRSYPGRGRIPALSGKLMVDTWRGVVRVRKWPDKRGTPKSAKVRAQNQWFRDANRMARFAPASQQRLAITATRNSGLYPRDLLLMAMAGNLFDLPMADGSVITKRRYGVEPVSYQGTAVVTEVNSALVANVAKNIIWTLPVRDTAGMWDIGSPSILTIQDGISLVQISASATVTGSFAGRLAATVRHNGNIVGRARYENQVTHTANIVCPLLPVSPMDTIALELLLNVNGTVLGDGTAGLTVTIVEVP